MEHCYRELNQLDMAERCAAEARKCAMLESGGFAKPTTPVRYPKNRPQLSVIVPTYNRLPILKKCLAALEAQTLSAQNFEVIVIDDGSSDGTEEFMRQYSAPFQLQYIRQKNGGTESISVEHSKFQTEIRSLIWTSHSEICTTHAFPESKNAKLGGN